MRKLYFCILAFFIVFIAQSQIINFTNVNLKQRLLSAGPVVSQYAKDLSGNFVKIDANSNSQIEVSEAQNISWLNVGSCDTDNLVGIEYFTNLVTFHCSYNPITTLGNATDGMANLLTLVCKNTQISSIDAAIALHPGLTSITASNNPNFTTIDLSGLHQLQYLYLDHCNNLQSVDTSASYNMIQAWLDYCPNLQLLNIKNGVDEDCTFYYCPSLHYICCDDVEYSDVSYRATLDAASGCIVNGYCSINPGGQLYVINGSEKFDNDSNGCGIGDPYYRHLKFTLSSSATYNTYFGNYNGQHSFGVNAGIYTLTPIMENPTYFTISPSSTTIIFPSESSPATRNFCISPNGVHPDLEIFMVPITRARPGFNSIYKIIYKNNGNTLQSGTVNLTFDSSILTLQSGSDVPSSQSGNTLSWNFTNLFPFEARELTVVLKVNSPLQSPPVNIGNVLSYNCTVTSPAIDGTPSNNTAVLSQTVVGSFDPNDKRCLEGTTVSTTQVGDYVHYIIRFENTGTYPAENVIVTDAISSTKFQINTLVPLSGSHPFITRFVGNKVEFLFEGINLPFDDANNDGYIAFKIKTKPTLVVGDSFSNSANIYFDYNSPIVTNTTTTTIQTLGNSDFNFNAAFSLSPVPTKNSLTISTKQSITISSVSIYNTLGQLIQINTNPNPNETIDVSSLKSGSYFIMIMSDRGKSSSKFIKE